MTGRVFRVYSPEAEGGTTEWGTFDSRRIARDILKEIARRNERRARTRIHWKGEDRLIIEHQFASAYTFFVGYYIMEYIVNVPLMRHTPKYIEMVNGVYDA